MTDNSNNYTNAQHKNAPTTANPRNQETAAPTNEQQDLLEPEKIGDFIIGKWEENRNSEERVIAICR